MNFEPKSDQEIRKMATQEWRTILAKLWGAFGKPINKDQFKVYADTLGDVPLGVLEHVVDEVIRRHKFNSVPTLGEITEVLEDLHPDYRHALYVHTRPNRDARNRQRLVDRMPEYDAMEV